jgi:hypothetical protein
MMPMKLYEVELKRSSYVTYVVEALDESHAEEEAWKLLERDGRADNGDAYWDVQFVERYEP